MITEKILLYVSGGLAVALLASGFVCLTYKAQRDLAVANLEKQRARYTQAALEQSERFREREQKTTERFDEIERRYRDERAKPMDNGLRERAANVRRLSESPAVAAAPATDPIGFVIPHLVRSAERYERLGSIAQEVRNLESLYNECVEYGRAERVN